MSRVIGDGIRVGSFKDGALWWWPSAASVERLCLLVEESLLPPELAIINQREMAGKDRQCMQYTHSTLNNLWGSRV